jgi:hypothetical protein
MGNFDCCKFGINKIQCEKRDADAASAPLQEMGEVINELKNKKREFPSGGVVNDSAQGEFVAKKTSKAERYKVKPQYLKYAAKLLGEEYNTSKSLMVGYEFTRGGEDFRTLHAAGVLDLWCEEVEEEVKEEWRCPNFTLAGHIDNAIWKKAKLMIRMQSWADFHNNMDGFVPDWCNTDTQTRWGIILDRKRFKADWHPYNYLLFQICVGSQVRSKQMLDYFEAEIQELINLKAI